MEGSDGKKMRDWKNNYWIGIIVVIITGLITSLLYNVYIDNSEKNDLKSNIEPLLRKADSLHSSGELEDAINEYETLTIFKICAFKPVLDIT